MEFTPTQKQRAALAENERLQFESIQLTAEIRRRHGEDTRKLMSRLRKNIERVKAPNLRELCRTLVARR